MARVLVVDDEPKLGRVVGQMLELDGHAVVRAGGGKEALARLSAERFDVVVTDLRMPEVDGLAVLRAARIAGLSATRSGVSRATRLERSRSAARCAASRPTRSRSSSIENGFVT